MQDGQLYSDGILKCLVAQLQEERMEEALKARQNALEQDIIGCLNEIKVNQGNIGEVSQRRSAVIEYHVFCKTGLQRMWRSPQGCKLFASHS